MTTDESLPHAPSVNTIPSEEEPQAAMPAQPVVASVILPPQVEEEEEPFYVYEEEQPDLEVAFVAPFQRSSALPTVAAQVGSSDQVAVNNAEAATPPRKTGRPSRFSLAMIGLLVGVVMVVSLLIMNALAQTTPPLQSVQSSHHALPPASSKQQPPVRPSPAPTPMQTQGTSGQGQPQPSSDWVPQQVPDGWTHAGLGFGDAIQAMRTALAFNDREMSLDYRSVGTRAAHGGTFTAATFVMTPAAMQRFQHDDMRMINNALFDRVVTTQLIRLVVNAQPHLITFVQQGQEAFAWVEVAFQLWQSQIDPHHPPSRMEGKELDPTTQQPRIHHMMVLLLRVPAQNAGAAPAMGGTGWLVSTYGLDLPKDTPLAIVQPA